MLRSVVIAMLALACSSVSAVEPALTWNEFNGVVFVTGGIGEEELEEINAVRGEFNLKLLLAEKSGTYLAGVQVVVLDENGKTVLDVQEAGPVLLAKVPPGSYRISAIRENLVQKRSLNIRAGVLQTLVIHW